MKKLFIILLFPFVYLSADQVNLNTSLYNYFPENSVAYVFGGTINIRSKPMLKSAKITRVYEGQKLTVVKPSDKSEKIGKRNINWIQIKTPSGKQGYIYGIYLTPFGQKIGRNILLVGIKEKALRQYQMRLVAPNSRLIKKWDLKKYTRPPSLFFQMNKNFFTKSRHLLYFHIGIGDSCPTGSEYLIYTLDGKMRLKQILKKIGGSDPPVSHRFQYTFHRKNRTIVELEQEYSKIESGIPDFEKQTVYRFNRSGKLLHKKEKVLKGQ